MIRHPPKYLQFQASIEKWYVATKSCSRPNAIFVCDSFWCRYLAFTCFRRRLQREGGTLFNYSCWIRATLNSSLQDAYVPPILKIPVIAMAFSWIRLRHSSWPKLTCWISVTQNKRSGYVAKSGVAKGGCGPYCFVVESGNPNFVFFWTDASHNRIRIDYVRFVVGCIEANTIPTGRKHQLQAEPMYTGWVDIRPVRKSMAF
jgi:hypothetical protein